MLKIINATFSVIIVAVCKRKTYQTVTILKRIKTVRICTFPAIIFTHCCAFVYNYCKLGCPSNEPSPEPSINMYKTVATTPTTIHRTDLSGNNSSIEYFLFEVGIIYTTIAHNMK